MKTQPMFLQLIRLTLLVGLLAGCGASANPISQSAPPTIAPRAALPTATSASAVSPVAKATSPARSTETTLPRPRPRGGAAQMSADSTIAPTGFTLTSPAVGR